MDENVLNALCSILADEEAEQAPSSTSSSGSSHRPRTASFQFLFGDELKEAVGEDCEFL